MEISSDAHLWSPWSSADNNAQPESTIWSFFAVKTQFAGSFKVPVGNEQRRCHPRCGGKTVTWFEVDLDRLALCLASLIAAAQVDSRIVGARQLQSCAELPGKRAN